MLLAILRAKKWQAAQIGKDNAKVSTTQSPITPPHPDLVIYNTDAAWKG